MKLYDIVKSLQNAKGSLEKQAILDANKDNVLFKNYMKATYDVGLNYYVTNKAIKNQPEGDLGTMDELLIEWMVQEVAQRRVSGSYAVSCLQQTLANLDIKGQELLRLMLDRKIGASVGDTMVLKTWPDLYFLPPYMRCSLMDKKAKERFSELKMFYVQTKCDGSFAYVGRDIHGVAFVYTRQGGKYPQYFADKMATGVPNGVVLVGELTVSENNPGIGLQTLDRKTGNGILTSVLKDGEGLQANQSVQLTAWDMLETHEFKAGKSTRKYRDRLNSLNFFRNGIGQSHIEIVNTVEVSSLEEAYTIYTDHTSRGLEGCVAKDPDGLWKDGTSKNDVKMKLKFEVEMRCVDYYEGEGKAAGMLGGVTLQSEDGELVNNCGSGFSDKQRKEFFENPELILNQVVAVEANDITQDRDLRKKPSLSLPIFVEVRNDKTVADTYAQIVAQHEAAKKG